MIVVIQCASRKQPDAGTLRTKAGRPVLFVADPPPAPHDRFAYARPDDLSDTGETWRNVLIRYVRESPGNPLGLLPAYQLYAEPIYRRLAERFGVERLFILSAGWGLIAAFEMMRRAEPPAFSDVSWAESDDEIPFGDGG